MAFRADVVVYSLTKYVNGHSDVLMGAIVTSREDIRDKLAFLQNCSCYNFNFVELYEFDLMIGEVKFAVIHIVILWFVIVWEFLWLGSSGRCSVSLWLLPSFKERSNSSRTHAAAHAKCFKGCGILIEPSKSGKGFASWFTQSSAACTCSTAILWTFRFNIFLPETFQ